MSEWADYKWVDIHDEERRASICNLPVSEIRKEVKALMLVNPDETTYARARARYEEGSWPILYFTSGGNGGMACKRYLDEMDGKMPTNLWPYSEVGHTDEAKKQLKALFEDSVPFDTPKPVRLLDRILTIASDKDSLVLDFFSGSATTAEAVIVASSSSNCPRRPPAAGATYATSARSASAAQARRSGRRWTRPTSSWSLAPCPSPCPTSASACCAWTNPV